MGGTWSDKFRQASFIKIRLSARRQVKPSTTLPNSRSATCARVPASNNSELTSRHTSTVSRQTYRKSWITSSSATRSRAYHGPMQSVL